MHAYLHEWPAWFSGAGKRSSVVSLDKPLTVADLVPVAWRGKAGLAVHHNGLPVFDFTAPVQHGDHVDVAIRPGALAGIDVVATLIANAVLFATLAAISYILAPAKPPKRKGDEESPQYAFSGLSNVRVEGQPKQVIYGEIRTAPQVLDEFIVLRNIPGEADLYMLLGFGEGPLEAFGDTDTDTSDLTPLSTEDQNNPVPRGIQVNGNNLGNFDDCEVYVRMGTNEQEPIPGFDQIATDYEVDAELTQLETTASDNYSLNPALDLVTIPYNSDAAGAQAVWDEYAFSFDLTANADSYRVVIDFPAGLYRLNSTGSIVDAHFQLLIRYIELDGGGAPITTGGDNNDGYVYVRPEVLLATHKQSPFSQEFAGPFIDPDGYTPPSLGTCLDCIDANERASTLAPVPGLPPQWATAGNEMTDFTIECWAMFEDLTNIDPETDRMLFEWSDASNRGFAFGLRRKQFGGFLDRYWLPAIWFGNGSTSIHFSLTSSSITPPYYIDDNDGAATSWYHLAYTYKAATATVPGRHRIYVNGELAYELPFAGTNLNIETPGTTAWNVCRSTNFAASTSDIGLCRIDELRLSKVELSPVQVRQRYNFGQGSQGADDTDLVGGWHFDDSPGTTATDYSGNGNTLFVTGGTTGTVDGFVYSHASTNVPLRSKFRVECLRLNLKSTSSLISDDSTWSLLYGLLDANLSYPNTPLLGLKIKASEQLNSTAPTVTALVKGRQVPIWDGTEIAYSWSANPAWVALDIATNARYGRGADFTFDDCDLTSFLELADYCDGLIYDGKGRLDIDEADGTADISDITYDDDGTDRILTLYFRLGFEPPTHWAVGGHLGFSGLPTGGVMLQDLNSTTIDGYEIKSMSGSGGQWIIVLIYDDDTYAYPPWAGSAFLGTAATLTDALVFGVERRFSYDGTFDTFKPAWDALVECLATARAIPIKEGNRLRVKYERARSAVGLVTHATIKEGSFEVTYTGPREHPNSYQIDFLDRDQNYNRSTVSIDDPALDADAAEEDIRRESMSLEGVVRRSQVIRHALFLLNVNRLLTKTGRFRTGLEALPYEVGDVLRVSHDIVPWGKGGRCLTGCTTTTLELDRQLILEAATTYYITFRSNAAGQSGSGSTVSDPLYTAQITSAAGTYARGDTITCNALSVAPAKDDPYVVYTAAEEFKVQVVSTTLTEDFEREITWVKYSDDVYDVDTLPDDLPTSIDVVSDPTVGAWTLPGAVTDAVVRELPRRGIDGGRTSELGVSWNLDPDTERFVSTVRIYTRVRGDAGDWVYAGSADGKRGSAIVPLRHDEPGSTIDVAIQPVSVGGAAQRPDLCRRASLVTTGFGMAPPAPEGLTCTMGPEGATYVVEPPENARGLLYEARRGGWVLGQPVFLASGPTEGPSSNWASGTANALGETCPVVVLRSRDGRGMLSEAVRVEDFDPEAVGSEVLVGTAAATEVYGDESWEDHGTGWVGGSGFVAAAVSGLQVTAYDGRDCLEFSGSNLEGTYTTARAIASETARPERMYVEAFAVADQVPPITVEDMLVPIGDPGMDRFTVEGAIALNAGETENCTLTIEWRWSTGSGFGDWVPYKPGIYFLVAPQFRIRVTRPDEDYQVRIYRFHTRLSRIAPQRFERTPVRRFVEDRILRYS